MPKKAFSPPPQDFAARLPIDCGPRVSHPRDFRSNAGSVLPYRLRPRAPRRRAAWREAVVARTLLGIVACFALAAVAGAAIASPIGPPGFVMIFEGQVGDLSMPNRGGSIPGLNDPNGLLGGLIAPGDAVKIRITTQPLSTIDLDPSQVLVGPSDDLQLGTFGYAALPGSTYSITIGNLKWSATGVSINTEETPWVDAVSINTLESRSDGSPLASAPFWDANTMFADLARSLPVLVDPFEVPDPATWGGSGFVLNGNDGVSELFNIAGNLTRTTVAPIPEPTAALVFAAGLLCVWRGLRPSRDHL
jgi:hypothetical protein